jgi:hypothetical protein
MGTNPESYLLVQCEHSWAGWSRLTIRYPLGVIFELREADREYRKVLFHRSVTQQDLSTLEPGYVHKPNLPWPPLRAHLWALVRGDFASGVKASSAP